MTITGPTKGSQLDTITSISGSERLIAVATVAGSLQTVRIPVSTITGYTPPALNDITDVSIQNLVDNHVLAWSSASQQYVLKNFTIAVASLSDVSVATLADGQYLVYNASAGKWVNQSDSFVTQGSLSSALGPYITSASTMTLLSGFSSVAHTHTLNDLSDVSAVSPTDNHVLSWSSAKSQWVVTPPTTGITDISAANDVSVSSPTTGQFLRYDASTQEWKNQTVDVVTSASLATILTPYLTSASLVTALTPYITSASIVTLLTTGYASIGIVEAKNIQALSNVSVSSASEGQFLIWNSVKSEFENRTVDVVTSASLATILTPYLTSASLVTALGPYITSASVGSLLTPYITSSSVVTLLSGDKGEVKISSGRWEVSTGTSGSVIGRLNTANTYSAAQIGAVLSVAYSASITLDFSTANNFGIDSLTGNITLVNPTNQVAGQSGLIILTQNVSGGKIVTWGTNWLFPASTEPALSTAASARDVLYYYVQSNGVIYCNLIKGFG